MRREISPAELKQAGTISSVQHWSQDEDHRALLAAREEGVALCTVVGIEGSFSRRLGAQLAVMPEGRLIGSLADGCLEAQLRSDCAVATTPVVRRYGSGSEKVDFRLPCGGGLDILIDPLPDRETCAAVAANLEGRREGELPLPPNEYLQVRRYIPRAVVRVYGDGPELEAVRRIAQASGISCDVGERRELALGRGSGRPIDPWTAIVLLFHDHEWEEGLLREALASEAFYIGAQGGKLAREARTNSLRRRGATEGDILRIRSPVGVPSGSRSPDALALSVLAEVMGEYESLRPST